MKTLGTIRTTNQVIGAIAPRLTGALARRLLMRPHQYTPRDGERAALASAERITLRFGLSALRWGGPGPIVLMMHGWSGRPTQFRHLVPELVAAGRQVIALDAPAHGRSPGEEAHPLAFTEAVLEAAGELKHVESVVGHSMGGAAVMLALAQQPFAERAVVFGAPAAMSRVLERFARTIALPHAAKRAFFEIVDRHVGVPARELDVTRYESALSMPGLVVHDRDDDSVPFGEAEAIAAAWPHARLIATRGLGHRRVLSDPGVVAAVSRFLTAGAPGMARLLAS
jgi:pimeloyl-ACP methyl ester carboxylesterase